MLTGIFVHCGVSLVRRGWSFVPERPAGLRVGHLRSGAEEGEDQGGDGRQGLRGISAPEILAPDVLHASRQAAEGVDPLGRSGGKSPDVRCPASGR